jgi:hypothetical protein
MRSKKKLSLSKRVIIKLQSNYLLAMQGGTMLLDTKALEGCPSAKNCDKTTEKRLTCTCTKD